MKKFTWQQEEDFMKATLQFSLDDAIDWIQRNLYPLDVFGKAALGEWAESEGYTKE